MSIELCLSCPYCNLYICRNQNCITCNNKCNCINKCTQCGIEDYVELLYSEEYICTKNGCISIGKYVLICEDCKKD